MGPGAVVRTQLYDQHVHSRLSWDCRSDPRDNVRAAIQRGLAGLTFTEHFDTHPDEWERCAYDDAACRQTIAALREEFGRQLWIGHGVEVCYQPEQMDFILDFLASHEFDLVILSVHWSAGRCLHERDHWVGLDPVSGTRTYLQAVLQAVRHCRDLRRKHRRPCFDLLGHLDLVKRYSKRFFGQVCVDQQGDLLDEILRTCLEADLVPEVNTSTLRQGLDEPMPGPQTIGRFAALGGGIMALGSDAHLPESVGAGFDRAAGMLREAGISRLAVYRDRRRQVLPLSA